VAPKTADPFYLTQAWRSLAEAVKQARGYRCEDCGAAGRPGDRMVADHVQEIADGGARLDPGNIRVLCPACHARKTVAAARSRRARG